MSRKKFNAMGIGAAIAGAATAAFVGMGTAHADTAFPDPYTAPDPYDVLFGAQGGQGVADNNLDLVDAAKNPSQFEGFMKAVDAFESTSGDHGLENLVHAIDPSAFYEQTGGLDPGFAGTILDSGGAYLVPDSFLGYLSTGLDYGLLTPTGLDYVLTPLIDILTGQPFG
jgi:hypothetical protein